MTKEADKYVNTVKGAQSGQRKYQNLRAKTKRSTGSAEQGIQEIRVKSDKDAAPTKELKATAYHEAGHAVVLWSLGEKFKTVTIVPKDETLGHVLRRTYPKGFNPEVEVTPRMRLRFEAIIASLLAGQIAEAKFLGRPVHSGMESDYQSAVEHTSYLFGSNKTMQAYLTFTSSLARDVVNSYWWAVKVVAEELLVRKLMNYNEVVDALQGAILSGRAQLLKTTENK